MARAAVAATAVVVVALSSVWASPGPLVFFGTGVPTPVPAGDFRALAAAGGSQTLAIRSDGTLYLGGTGAIPSIPAAIASETFEAAGMGRNHALAIRPDGTIAVWGVWFWSTAPPGTPQPPATPPPSTSALFKAVTGGGSHSVALDVAGNVVVWGSVPALGADYQAVVGVGAPAGTSQAIAAKGRFTLALSDDGHFYGWGADGAAPPTQQVVNNIFKKSPWTPDGTGHFIAPYEAGNPYTAITASLDLIAGLRADGSVIVWDANTTRADRMQLPPAGVVFEQIAAGTGYVTGIDETGHLHAWGDPGVPASPGVPANAGASAVINFVKKGVYSAISASNAYVTAIAVPDPQLTSLAPASIWLGLKNSDDIGTRFDLRAEVLEHGTVVGSGQLDGVAGGSSGFSNAVERTIALSMSQPVPLTTDDTMSLRLSVRIAADGIGHRSGTARLWFNDAAADSGFGATIGGYEAPYYIVGATGPSSYGLTNALGVGPRRSVDVFVDRAANGNPFKPFGTWSIVLR